MPLYRFYRIVSKTDAESECYIGQTIQPLHKRFHAHSKAKNKCSSKLLFEKYGKENLEIILIHEQELPSRQEALREERRLFEEYSEKRVNRFRPIVTPEERDENHKALTKRWHEEHKEKHKELNHQWYELNKHTVKERGTEYRKTNKAKISERMSEWFQCHKDEIKEHRQKYYQDNKAKILEKQRQTNAQKKLTERESQT